MSDTVENLVLGVAFVVVLVALILRRRNIGAKPKKATQTNIGRGR
jgi:hypothetical protein